VGNALPGVALTSPPNGSVLVAPESLTIRATAGDPYGQVSKVDFLANGLTLGTSMSAPYEFTWENPPPGTHLLSAVATDNASATGESTVVTLTVLDSVSLQVERQGEQVELGWPATAGTFSVEFTTNLTMPVFWEPFTNPVTEINGQFIVPVDLELREQYFRLKSN
jgi:hypothetical protein